MNALSILKLTVFSARTANTEPEILRAHAVHNTQAVHCVNRLLSSADWRAGAPALLSAQSFRERWRWLKARASWSGFEKDGEIGVITVDNPPVNAMSPGVPEGIVAALDKGNADPAVKAMVLIGAGRSFIAGADIRQFGKGPSTPPTGRRHYNVMDEGDKPVVAAIHGYALGGGLETALACHYRVAVPSARVGLPEVQIGILPGAGGTQRLPRLIGPKAALDMIVTGRHVPAEEAHKLGIIDELAPEGQLKEAAIAFARRVADTRPLPRLRDRNERLAEGTPEVFENMRKSIARRARNQRAPYACIEAVEAACKMPFDEGCAFERKLFDELVGSEEARALRYAFFAEREVTKLPHIPAGTATAPDGKTRRDRRRHDGRRHRDELRR